jgi:cytochrome oxidase Cu insertion factor (SCO1/SenC/PrrC family)
MCRCFRWRLLLAAGLMAAGCYQKDAAQSRKMSSPPVGAVTEGVREGQRAPEITGVDGDGVQFKLSDYRGKVVLLDFWFER